MKTEKVRIGKKVADISVGEDGHVPQDVLVSHFLTSVKDTNKDYDEHASVLLPVNITPRQAAPWWINPNRHDVMFIDAPGKPQYNVDHIKNEESKKIHQLIGIVATPQQEKKVRQMIDETYTIEEKRKMVENGGIILTVRPLKDSSGEIEGRMIRLDTATGVNESTLVHEGTHHLRRVDPDRKNKLTRTAVNLPIKGNGASAKKRLEDEALRKVTVEESCTVAEQMARAKNPRTGYYTLVQVYDEKSKRWRYPTDDEALQMMKEDRMLMTNGTGKPLSSKEAIKSVENNWIKSHISRLKLPGAPRSAAKEIELIEQSSEISQKAMSDIKYRPRRSGAKCAVSRSPTKVAARKAVNAAPNKRAAQSTKSKTNGRKKQCA